MIRKFQSGDQNGPIWQGRNREIWRMKANVHEPAGSRSQRFRTMPQRAGCRHGVAGAPGRIRTCDLRIRSPLLCPLSYGGVAGALRYESAPIVVPWRLPLARFPVNLPVLAQLAAQKRVHRVGRVPFHGLDHAGVSAGRRDGRVPEDLWTTSIGLPDASKSVAPLWRSSRYFVRGRPARSRIT